MVRARPALRTRLFAVLLALSTAGGLARAGDDDTASPPNPPPPTAPPPKVFTSFDEAQAEARGQDRLLFVRLASDPGDARLSLSNEQRRTIAKACVLAIVTAKVGDDAADALRVRYHLLDADPAWIVVTPSGALLETVRPSDSPPDVEALLARAAEDARSYASERRRLEARRDADRPAALLRFLLDHRDFDPVLSRCEQTLSSDADPPAELLGAYASALGATGRREEERVVLARMLELWPSHPDAVEWRIGAAEAPFDPLLLALARQRDPAGDAVREAGGKPMYLLLAKRRLPGRTAEVARIRYEIASTFARNDAEALAHFDWVADHAPDTWYGADSFLRLGQSMENLGLVAESVRYFQGFLQHHPDDARAAEVRARLADLQRGARTPAALDVRVQVAPERPVVGLPLAVTVRVENTGPAPLSGVLVRSVSYGHVEDLTQESVRLPSLGPGEVQRVEFRIKPKGPGRIHLVASAEAGATVASGRWLCVGVP